MEKDYLLKKWLNDELSIEEKEIFEASEEYPLYQKILEEGQRFKAKEMVSAASFHDFEKKWLADGVMISQKQKKTTYGSWIVGIAATVLVIFGINAFFNSAQTNYSTGIAESKEVNLPDNSLVVLNAVSKINLDENNWEDNRSLSLEGEAFFDVEKGSKFKVQTAKGEITVLGTEFNVRQRGDALSVVCFEGRVKVQNETNEVILEHGETAYIVKGILKKGIAQESQPSWKSGWTRFTDTEVEEVFKELERHFEVEIVREAVDTHVLFTGAFGHDNIKEALKGITQPLGIRYKMEDKKVILIPSE